LAGPITQSNQSETRRGRPEAGAPAAVLPNLDEVRRKRHPRPETPAALPSLMRSRRKPVLPRNGRKVGDASTGVEANGITQSMPAAPGKETISNPNAISWGTLSPSPRSQTKRRHHSSKSLPPNGALPQPPPITDDDYVARWFTYALTRSAYGNELTYWEDLLRAAYTHSQPSLVMATREMGKTLFESAEYVARSRSDHDYIYDLYKTYLMRSPDSGGWAYWEGQLPSLGRENVRRAFDECAEFVSKVATVTLTGSASSTVSSLLAARLDLQNQSGNQVLARNSEWSLSLLSLPGRSGLDLGLGLTYSSAAVWSRSGPYIYFDEDNSSLSPGFRIGFPIIQEKYFNAETGQDAYLLITSAGTRVELRQVSATLYQAFDSSYVQLTDLGSSLLLRSTDGTQMAYTKIENEWKCTNVKDRNGNYLSVTYNSLGDLLTVKDTVWRTITFNYDSNGNLVSIAQDLNGIPRNVVTFGWGTTTVAPGFSGVAVSGVANGQSVPVLTMVGLTDGSYYRFSYPISPEAQTGQVTLIKHFASDSNPVLDNHKLGEVAFDYASTSNDATPRLTASRVRAIENWNGSNGVPSEVTTQYSAASDNSWAKITFPDGTIYKEFYATTTWQKRLTVETKIHVSPSAEQSDLFEKRTTIALTHDGGANATYPSNPRLTETNIYDSSGNRRRTRVGDWNSFTLPGGTSCTLPKNVYEYDANATTVLRRRRTDYVTTSAYLDRWIIGLPQAQYLCDGAQGESSCGDTSGASLLAKTTFQYDEPNSVEYQAAPVQHDEANYGSVSVPGRGNLSSTRRYDVTNLTQYTASTVVYNTAGSVIRSIDPAGHQVSVNYTDSFSADGTNPTYLSVATQAYPTTVTDADGFSSLARYHYDFASQTRVEGPPPAGQSQGTVQIYSYDNAGRRTRTTLSNSAYVRFVYGSNYVQSYATVNNVADDSYTIETFDGAGRVIGEAGSHPNSSGTYKAQLTVYDRMGRVVKRSNPTEINTQWVPYGDDAGWLYSTQTYDWNGRPLATTNQDGNSTKEVIYGGCGCAGGEIVITRDEVGRRQKTVYDALARPLKTQVLYSQPKNQALNGDGAVYSTAANTYNARDQLTLLREFQGPGPSNPNDLSCPTDILHFVSDTSWKQTLNPGSGWKDVNHNDSGWATAVDEGAFPTNPWSTWVDFPTVNPPHWLWYYDSRNGSDYSTVYFRKTFVATSLTAGLKITADNSFTAYLNGTQVASGTNWQQPQSVTLSLQPGSTYVLAVSVTNSGGPGGLLAYLDSSGATCQQSTMSYDGYGRLKTAHRPEQQLDPYNGLSSNHTTWDYNADDTTQKVTDARGASSSFTYNGRHQITRINYYAPTVSSPGSSIPASPQVDFEYDAAGNRSWMNENGERRVTYHYDALSRMDWEERTFSGLSNSYRINYGYNLAGQLTNITEPSQFGTGIGYQYDSSGRLNAVTGSGYTYSTFPNAQTRLEVPVGTFASNIKYRAWDNMKDMDDGNGVHHHFNFNSRLLATDYTVNNLAGSISSMQWNYDYFDDGNLNHAYDVADNHFDRAYAYDQVGRLSEAYTGREARGETIPPNTLPDSPYRQTYTYDIAGNQLSQTGRWWQYSMGTGYAYSNNRQLGLGYDAAGHPTADGMGTHTYDARGARTLVTTGNVGGGLTGHPNQPAEEDANTYDGDGQLTKTIVTTRTEEEIEEGPETNISVSTASTYYLRSTVLGGYVLSELDGQGQKSKGYIYAAGERIAEQVTTPYYNTIAWQHKNPLTGSWVEVAAADAMPTRHEMDPMGRGVGTAAPPIPSEPSPPARTAYYEIEGGQTAEGELGMQLYEDMYINRVFGKGFGPGQGGFWEAWRQHELEREFQLMVGQRFLSGVDRTLAGGEAQFEYVDDSYDMAIDVHGGIKGGTTADFGMTIIHVTQGYYRLLPGSQGKKGEKKKELKTPVALNATVEQQERFAAAFADLMTRLGADEGKNPCAELFGGYNKAVDALKNSVFSFVDLGAPFASDFGEYAQAATKGKNVYINSKAGFMATNGEVPTTRSTLLNGGFPGERRFVTRADVPGGGFVEFRNDVRFASFTLLHELGHRRGIYSNDDKDNVDDKNGTRLEKIARNNQKILDACFPVPKS